MPDADAVQVEIPGELQETERAAFERFLNGIGLFTGEQYDAVVTTWLAARSLYGADQDGISVDVVRTDLERIVVVADEANKPLHRNEMRVDWADSLGAGERRYVMALRGTLAEVSRLATAAIVQGKNACLCQRQPGTNPSCPLHQLESSDQ